ncbi:hypothetical protein DOTSEDRAFT_80971 [Dothistroma septosporum NZE10]|uniref:BRCT domain-containing protein n=1 Tax=Dothistroma septosporum (strain NZE10 / CBS 128990) TaxID=675120 RepID=M2WNT4_DOTSN|nr:hypothetical protein DOTSEDRAFT_80971 [Dothistroma septosporum NZE10]
MDCLSPTRFSRDLAGQSRDLRENLMTRSPALIACSNFTLRRCDTSHLTSRSRREAMASAETDSSMGSVPQSVLLLAQKDMFEGIEPYNAPEFQHVESESARERCTTKQAQWTIEAIDNMPESAPLPATVPESADVNGASNEAQSIQISYMSPESVQKRRIPRLSPSKSAPAAEREALIQSTPSQQAFVQLTKAKSFSAGLAPDDTQPFGSQLYTESMVGQSITDQQTTPLQPAMSIAATPKTHETLLDTSPNTYNTLGSVMSKTQKTLQEGETGYVDLQWDTQQQSPATSTQGFEELLESQNPETQIPVPLSNGMPETPLLAGRKRKAADELPTSAVTRKRTPHYSQAFDFSTTKPPLMTNTQLFQDQSSPLPDVPRSDPIASRPSPTSNDLNSTSSPARPIFSSPAVLRDARPRSAPGEPRETYMSMEESQERRRLMMEARKRAEREARGVESEDDDFKDSEDHRLHARNMRRAFSEQAKQDAARLGTSYPALSRPTSGKKPNATIDLVTPGTIQRGKRISFEDISDDEAVVDEAVLEEEHDEGLPESPRHDEEFEDHADDATDNDEYDELGQAVLKSQSNDHSEDDDHQSIAESFVPQEPEGEADDELALVTDDSNGVQPMTTTQGTQRSTIADSQPTANHKHSQGPQVSQIVQSFTSSFVPGSHYHQGKTSEEQAIASSQRMAPPTIAASQGNVERSSEAERVPSSPPRLTTHSTLPDDADEASMQRQELLNKFHNGRSCMNEESTEQEIPESDLPEVGSERPETAQDHLNDETQDTGNGAPYSTARTHVSASARSPAAKSSAAPSPAKVFASQQSRRTEDSPRKRAGVRRFSSIATDPTSVVASFDAMADVDEVFENVMTDEDRAVLKVTSDPPEQAPQYKRRQLVRGRSSENASSELNLPTPVMYDTLEQEQPVEQSAQRDINAIDMEEEDELSRPEPTPQPLRDSPSKANERPAFPTDGGLKSQSYSSESILAREKAGSDAVSQLVRTRSAVKRIKKTTYGRASRRKSSRSEGDARKTNTNSNQAVPKEVVEMNDLAHDELDRHQDLVEAAVEDAVEDAVENADQVNASNAGSALKGTHNDDNSSDDPLHSEHYDQGVVEGKTVVAPRRILALFKGSYNGFYPATWLASSPDGTTYSLRFDDGTVTDLETQHVRSLDIRIGEVVKVDKAGLRNKQWVVTGLGPAPTTREERGLVTDIYGNIRVQVQARSSRSSPPKNATTAADESGETHVVLISELYFTMMMWVHFRGTGFTPPSKKAEAKAESAKERASTPSTRTTTPSIGTPASRSRRPTAPGKARLSLGRTSHLREGSVASSISNRPTAVFSNMAFAVSYVSNELEKSGITRIIQRNGGLVLDDGFEQLFELPALSAPPSTSPKKRTPKKQHGNEHEHTGLRLKDEYRDLGFVAVIADKHSRRAKYMQALALGLPTLSGRWILHSLDISKNTSLAEGQPAPLPWNRYVLPAGESSYLGGAVRSRLLQNYNAADAQAGSILPQRSLLLDGDTVLIVAPKKGKSGWEKRKTYAFLTVALGAGKVQRVTDLQEAKATLQADPEVPTWVYVDGAIADAEKAFFGGKAAASKKGKRGETSAEPDEKKHSARNGNVRIVDDEFVVQSLILGALID